MKLSDDHLRALKDRLIASGVVGKTVHWRGEDNTIIGFSQRWNDFGVHAKTSEGRAVDPHRDRLCGADRQRPDLSAARPPCGRRPSRPDAERHEAGALPGRSQGKRKEPCKGGLDLSAACIG